ncbi:MAG: DUF2059 domain-containing protein [Desulfobulbus sp.]|nr:DUF2059 domain-containing protein [Desulfobulbus sp.]
MKKMSVWIIASLGLFLFTSAYADDGNEQEAGALLETMHMDTVLGQSIDQMMAIQFQNPAMAPYRHIVEQFIKKYMSYGTLKPEMIKLYAQTFTKEELNDITAFYRTPTGQKAIQVMPQLMAQGAQIARAKMQEHMPELQQQIKEEVARQQQQQSQPQPAPQPAPQK